MNYLSTFRRSVITAAVVVTASASPALAATNASPDPAAPGETVTISPDADCAEIWDQLSTAGPAYGAIVVSWPDGTEELYGPPLPNPADVTVPAGMETGTASISVYKGVNASGEPDGYFSQCDGTFKIAEDATVPVADPTTIAGLVAAGGAGLWFVGRATPAGALSRSNQTH